MRCCDSSRIRVRMADSLDVQATDPVGAISVRYFNVEC